MRCATRLGKQARSIAGVAPVLHFPSAVVPADQVAQNTARAIELIRAQLGEKPEPYTPKHNVTFAQVEAEIENVLSSCGSDEAPLEDGKELTKLQVIERVLRHGVVQYKKELGSASYDEIQKWLVYTPQDQMEFNKLKREAELKEKYESFKQSGRPVLPEFDWAAEYANAIDREAVAEKRKRYDLVSASTFERDEAAVEAVLKEYREPRLAAALDRLVDQLAIFKPFLAKQVVEAKLADTAAEGQLTLTRFMDFNPDARDQGELEVDAHIEDPGTVYTQLDLYEFEKRYADVRMKTKEEVVAQMEKEQAASSTSSGSGGGGMDAAEARRAKVMQEIARLQASVAGVVDSKDDDATESAEEKEARLEAARVAEEKERERFSISDAVVREKGLLGLSFLDAKSA